MTKIKTKSKKNTKTKKWQKATFLVVFINFA